MRAPNDYDWVYVLLTTAPIATTQEAIRPDCQVRGFQGKVDQFVLSAREYKHIKRTAVPCSGHSRMD